MTGREKCRQLKHLRADIATVYGIEGFEFEECDFQGECTGTCPACDDELKQLTKLIEEAENRDGKRRILYGLEGLREMSRLEAGNHNEYGEVVVIDTINQATQRFTYKPGKPTLKKGKKEKARAGLRGSVVVRPVERGGIGSSLIETSPINFISENTTYVFCEKTNKKRGLWGKRK